MRFQSTMWTVIGLARDGSREALEKLLVRYREPLLAYLRGRGVSEHDAEDLAQEVFLQISSEEFLKKADRAKGRFRTLLLRVTQHLLSSGLRKHYSLKRGGGCKRLSIEDLPEGADPPVADDSFDGLWARNLLRLALEKLEAETSRLKVPYHRALVLRYVEGRSPPDIAARLGCKTHDVDNYLYQGKRRLRRHIEALAGEYCSSHEELGEEVEMLRKHLG